MFTFSKDYPLIDLGAGVSRRILAHGGAMMAVEVHFLAGAIDPMHNYPHEQLTWGVKPNCTKTHAKYVFYTDGADLMP